MTVPAFGHGELEWLVKNGQGKPRLIAKYALPWDHPEHTPNMIGSATFFGSNNSATASGTTVHYIIRYFAAAPAQERQTLQSVDGKLKVTVSTNGTQTNELYFALIQGYTHPQITVAGTAYELIALAVPSIQDAANTSNSNWRYPWNGDYEQEQLLPKAYTVNVELTSPGELCRWIGWKIPAPAHDMEDVDPVEMTKLRRLGIFMIEEIH